MPIAGAYDLPLDPAAVPTPRAVPPTASNSLPSAAMAPAGGLTALSRLLNTVGGAPSFGQAMAVAMQVPQGESGAVQATPPPETAATGPLLPEITPEVGSPRGASPAPAAMPARGGVMARGESKLPGARKLPTDGKPGPDVASADAPQPDPPPPAVPAPLLVVSSPAPNAAASSSPAPSSPPVQAHGVQSARTGETAPRVVDVPAAGESPQVPSTMAPGPGDMTPHPASSGPDVVPSGVAQVAVAPALPATSTATPPAAATGTAATAPAEGRPELTYQLPAHPGAVERLTIRLSPQELGSVTVEIRAGGDGPRQVHVLIDRQETLSLFQQDRQHLTAALGHAGLDTDAANVTVSLAHDPSIARDAPSAAPPVGAQHTPGQAGDSANGGRQAPQQAPARAMGGGSGAAGVPEDGTTASAIPIRPALSYAVLDILA